MKRFSTMRDTQSCSQSYMKRRRGRREIRDEQEEKKGDSRGERERSTQLSVPKVFSVAQTPTKIHRIGLRRERKGGSGVVLR